MRAGEKRGGQGGVASAIVLLETGVRRTTIRTLIQRERSKKKKGLARKAGRKKSLARRQTKAVDTRRAKKGEGH